MPEIVHNIDLKSVPHQPGQSLDLEAKRLRAWNRLSDEEKEWILEAWDLTGMIPSAPAFRELKSAGDRVLYVLVGTEESLTPLELCYLMIARWFRNIDPATARAKMAQLVNQGAARYTGIGRTMGTEVGLERLEELAQTRRQAPSDDDDSEERSDHRTTTSRSRIVDRGESANSNFGNRRSPTGRYRSEIPNDGGRPGKPRDLSGDGDQQRGSGRDDRRDDSRGERGNEWRGDRTDDRGRKFRSPRRDDLDERSIDTRGGDSRGPSRDDRGGDSRGPRRDDRGGYSSGPSRDDRGGDSRGPRRDDRGGYSSGPSRDDRGGYSGGPRRDDRGGYSRGPSRDSGGGRDERRRVNTDGPRIDGKGENRSDQRVNTDGPIIDGRDKEPSSDNQD
ncbi:MAG: hypothetical protein O2974_02715 [Chloroflexi bacterium]|nr:hypothetical protein [Chloroflexota bacterium]